MNKKDMVQDFHSAFGANIGTKPILPDENERELRIKLLREEWEEYLEGETNDDIVEIADALGDMLYIIYGTCVSYGLPIDEIFKEIHDSNMSKLGEDGLPIRREDGKVLKGPNFFQPKLKEIIEKNL